MIQKVIPASLLLAFLTLTAEAQVITTSPVFPTSGDAVVVTFNADKGDMGLKDYTGDDVYAHTGVITDKSISSSDWKYVIATWSTNLPKAKLTKVSANVYTLTISPSIREFYGVPSGEKILKLAFVFRNSNGTRTGRDVGGADIFYDVTETPVFTVMLTLPDRYTSLVGAGDEVNIQASASMGDSLVLFQNNVRLTKSTSLSASYTLTASGSGLFKISAVAYNGLTSVRDSLFYYIKPPVTVEDPPAGMKAGANVTGDNSVLFMLYAPGKDNVFVVGDFNDWVFREEGYMKMSTDGKWFWKEVTGLDPLEEYGYQYVVDGTIRIADPYTTKVLDPWNDKFITEDTYPGLMQYPEGMADGLVSVFRTRPDIYEWKNTEFTSPSKEDLVVYELLVRDFVAAHDFKTIKDSLAYFSRLGINAIEFMPVCEFDGNSSWGYNPAMYFAVDKYYGPADSFKELIDSCHSRGIAVIMDMVLNHAYGNNPLVKLYYDEANNRPSTDNPWFNVVSPNPSYSWGYDFNHESTATQAFVDSVCHYWISEFMVDGFRFDFSKGFTNTPGNGYAYDASRINILKRMGNKIWLRKPNAHLILEHFTDNSEETNLANFGFMLWGDSKYNYQEAAMGYTSDLSNASYVYLGWNKPGLVTYMESHDEERMMYKNLNFGLASGSYDVKLLQTALKRVKLAASFFFTIPGPKMIWQFEELGYDYPLGEGDEKLAEKPVRWDYYTNTSRRNVFDNFSALINLKKNEPAFSSDNFTIYQTGKLKRLNIQDPTMDVVVTANFDVVNGSLNANFTRDGRWYEFFSGDSLDVTSTNSHQLIDLLPGEYRMYTSKKLTRPSFLVGIEKLPVAGEEDNLFSVYPNPFTNESRIILNGDPEEEITSVAIFSASGALVRILGPQSDSAEVIIDGTGLGSGIYYVRVTSGTRHGVLKVVRL